MEESVPCDKTIRPWLESLAAPGPGTWPRSDSLEDMRLLEECMLCEDETAEGGAENAATGGTGGVVSKNSSSTMVLGSVGSPETGRMLEDVVSKIASESDSRESEAGRRIKVLCEEGTNACPFSESAYEVCSVTTGPEM